MANCSIASVGWLLCVFAAASPPLFLGAQAVSAQSPSGSSVAEEVVFRPGDVVQITVWRKPELSGEFVVAADGSIGNPFYADVKIAGAGVGDARQRIRNHVARIEADPLVWVEPVFRVAVVGEVRQPGLFPVRYPTTLGQAIAQAGGTTDAARLDRIQFVRNGVTQVVNLRDPAAAAARTVLLSGDEIVVPRRSTTFRDSLVPISTLASIAALLVTITSR